MKKILLTLFALMGKTSVWSVTYVTADLMGQLGNQFFIIAAATSLAMDHGATAAFPDLKQVHAFNIPLNYQQVFSKINVDLESPIQNYYLEKNFHYDPIPFASNIKIRGWFQSERYFRHHKNEILELFAPSPQISTYLNEKYEFLINHPNTVSIHYRAYRKENPYNANVYADCNLQYFEKAISLFSSDALFVVFSDDITYCKEMFQNLPFQFYYIEGEAHYHDLYLMSFCKNNIICNSTFSWWGAYLNRNPDKKVIAPAEWFHPSYKTDTYDLIPEEWIVIK